MKKKIYIPLICAVVVGAVVVAAWQVKKALTVTPAVTADTWVYIHDGMVEPEGALDGTWLQRALDHYDFGERLASGQIDGAYLLDSGMAALPIARRIVSHQQTPIRLTFNNIRLKEQWAGRVSSRLLCDSASVMQAMLDPAFLAEAGMDTLNVIGLFLPDTYEVFWTITPQELMQRMLKEYRRFWNEVRQAKAEGLDLTPQEVTILASIAEEETRNRSERGTVAMLYWNRLQLGMLLQADPTVKYAMGDFGLRRILKSHLQTVSPYNTYLNRGLPPGPIRCVEKATIDTFLNTRTHPYIYMCARPQLDGRHNFATTYSEHLRNAAAYRQAIGNLKP